MFATLGPNLPLEVLMATGRYAGPLSADFDAPSPSAELWLESKFAPWAPPVLEAWKKGAFDGVEAVVFSRGDDSSQRLYYYVCELQRRGLIGGPEALIFDLAQIQRATSLDRTIAAVCALARRLGVDDVGLEAAIAEANTLRATAQSRKEGPSCLMAGTAPPDERLFDAVRAAGFVPVGCTLAQQWSALGALVDEGTTDPAAAIGRQLHARQEGPRSFASPALRLTENIHASGARAVVLWRIEEDEAHAWHLPEQRRALDTIGIPTLVMTRRDWLARDGAAEEITAFLEGLKG